MSQSKAVTGKAPSSARTPGKVSLEVFGTIFSTCLFTEHPVEACSQLGGEIALMGKAAGGAHRALAVGRVVAQLPFDPRNLHHQ